MTVFLISFGITTLIAAITWFIYVFLKENLIDYIGFNSIRRKIFRHKLKNREYVDDNSARSIYSKGSIDETALLSNNIDETVLLDGSDETTLL